jgi:ectoine hydroxylase-related dioxygenase (phytanoyl-CoA dioxygenase family)
MLAAHSRLPEGYAHDLGDGRYGMPEIPEIVRPSHLDPGLKKMSGYARLEDLARGLLGVDHVRHHFDHAIFKPAGNSPATPWHQDVAFDPEYDCPMATLWLSFGDVDATSGCMQYIPGSHMREVLPHVPNGHDGLRVAELDVSQAVLCPVPAGGVVAHAARTVHSSPSNVSEQPRLAWIIKFVVEDRSRPRQFVGDLKKRLREPTPKPGSW